MLKRRCGNLILKFINDLVGAAGARGAPLALSGGLGLSTVAILAARALGPDQAFAHPCRREE